MMEICSNGHPEIIHNEGWKNCPVCKLIKGHQDEIVDIEDELEELKDDFMRLTDEVSDLRAQNKKTKPEGESNNGVRP